MGNIHDGPARDLVFELLRVENGTAAPPTRSGEEFAPDTTHKVVHARISGSGNVSAVVEIYGNVIDDPTSGVLLATITLSGTNIAEDGFAFDAPWPFIQARCTAKTTAAILLVRMGT